MYLVQLMHVLTQGLKGVFGSGYTSQDGNQDFANLHVSIEYPVSPQDYPGVWVDFEPEGTLRRGGIDDINTFLSNPDDTLMPLYLWRAEGWATYTIACMTSLQRARLYDELVRVFAFNKDPQVANYRNYIENNDWLAMNMDFDQIAERGSSANLGTPWGDEDIVYEVTLAVQAVIEFYSPVNSQKLERLSAIKVFGSDGRGDWRDLIVSEVSGKDVNTSSTDAPPVNITPGARMAPIKMPPPDDPSWK